MTPKFHTKLHSGNGHQTSFVSECIWKDVFIFNSNAFSDTLLPRTAGGRLLHTVGP